MEPRRKYGLLTALYFSQGLPFGFFTRALPVMLRQRGVSLEGVGLSSMLFVPWALKFLWAPLVDRFYHPSVGRRRSWIIPLQFANVLLLAGLGIWQPEGSLAILLTTIFLINFVSASQDIATDGLAVELLNANERGIGNGIQVAAYRIGMVFGGGVLLILEDVVGWTTTFILMAILLLIATLPISLFQEPPPPTDPPPRGTPRRGHLLKPLVDFARSPGGATVFVLLFAFRFGDVLASAMFKPYLADLGFSRGDIGWISGLAGSVAGLTGALTGGLLIVPLGRVRALVSFTVLQALFIAAFGFFVLAHPPLPQEVVQAAQGTSLVDPSSTLWWGVMVLSAAEEFVSSLATAALFTCMMDWCREGHAASDYTLQASFEVILKGIAATFSGLAAAQLGYAGLFMLGAGLCLMGAFATPMLYAKILAQRTAQTHTPAS